MFPPSTILNIARAASLFLAFVFGIIGLATNANAFVVSSTQKDDILKIVPRRISISIDDSDVVGAGAAVLVFCIFIAAVSLISLSLLLLSLLKPAAKSGRLGRLAERATLLVQGAVLAVFTVALFAALVAMTDFVANRGAKVSASVRGVALPASVVQSVEQELGVTTVYHELGYLVAATVLPWFTFLFAASASVLSFVIARRERTVPDDKALEPAGTGEPKEEPHGDDRAEQSEV